MPPPPPVTDDRAADRRPLPRLRDVGLVAAGGALGALARVALGTAFPVSAGAWPTVTLVVNLGGAFALGALVTAVAELIPGRTWVRPLLGTGVIGAFTTFSTVALQLHRTVTGGSVALAAAYATASLVGGVLAAVAGMAGVRALAVRPGRHR